MDSLNRRQLMTRDLCFYYFKMRQATSESDSLMPRKRGRVLYALTKTTSRLIFFRWTDFLYHPRRISNNDTIFLDILGHHRSRPHYTAASYFDSSKDCHIPSNPAIIANLDKRRTSSIYSDRKSKF